jgi:hypothetical protein
VSALKRLQLEQCSVVDGGGVEGLTAALSLLPAGLEHYSIRGHLFNNSSVTLPTAVMQKLQQLTPLELSGPHINKVVQGPDGASLPLQPLQALTRRAG